ncbi:MAG: DNA replication protein psf2 [Chrysothrix sp. TS-e1954]|nr:MAG: DNA replication protein psf2 [Chrysothrix sp. TS-e1954]
MALPLPAGLTPPEIAFLCEMELVTVIPRQRMASLDLLGGKTSPLRPPHRADLPLWLALLLKRQGRADIAPPAWLYPDSLRQILDRETNDAHSDAFSPAPPLSRLAADLKTPPFMPTSVAAAPADFLPYHWLELGQTLLAAAADDVPDSEQVRRLLRDLREVRMAKVRQGVEVLDGGAGVQMDGVGATEVGEGRAFVTGVIDGLRKIGAAKETATRERAEEGGGLEGGDEDEEML